MKLLKLALIVSAALCVVAVVTIGWIEMVWRRYGNAGGNSALDIGSLLSLQHAPLYWLVVLAVMVLAGLVYWRWA